MKRLKVFVFVVAFAASAVPVLAAPVELTSYSTASTGDNLGNVNDSLGETFKTPNDGTNYYLTSVKFKVKKTGTPTGTLVAKLYAHTGSFGDGSTSKPTGAALATSTTSLGNADITTSYVEYTWSFAGTYQLTANTAYVIVLESSVDDGTNYFTFQDIHSDGASGLSGNLVYTQNNGGTWSAAAWDAHYAVWGDASVASGTSTPSTGSSTSTVDVSALVPLWETSNLYLQIVIELVVFGFSFTLARRLW